MPALAVDSSVLVAAHLPWHEHHLEARRALERAFDSATVIVPVPALLEAYSVRARLPSGVRRRGAGVTRVLQQAVRAKRDADVTKRLNDLFADQELVAEQTRAAEELDAAGTDWSDERW